MAHQPIGSKDIAGRTVERIARSGLRLALVFCDGTFCVVEVGSRWDEEPSAWFGNEAESRALLGERDSVYMNLQSLDELEARSLRLRALADKETEQRERAELARLKDKYEGEGERR